MLSLVFRQSRRSAWRESAFSKAQYSRRWLSTTNEETKAALRALLRETAQPVAVATSFYPLEDPDASASVHQSRTLPGRMVLGTEKPSEICAGSSECSGSSTLAHPRFHGATLSSFSSIAMDPYPLVSFSLRIPSRLAAALKSHLRTSKQQDKQRLVYTSNIVVNLLSHTQAATAALFAHPTVDPFDATPHTLSAEGLPVLTGALGALSCALVSCTPLHELCGSGMGEEADQGGKGGVISELFILRVVRVERTLAEGQNEHGGRTPLPLVYHHRRYATISPPES